MMQKGCCLNFTIICQNCTRKLCVLLMCTVSYIYVHRCELGPLWAYSCFGFENMNGVIKRDQHGCRNFLPSLTNAICMKISLSLHKNALMKSNQESDKTKRFSEKRFHNYYEDGSVGKIKTITLDESERQIPRNAGLTMDSNRIIRICVNTHHTKLERIQ